MYSLEELFLSFVIAVVFIFIFKLHRELFNESYWATSDILSDIDQAPSLKSVLVRFFIILIFGIILNFFVLPKIIILGMTLGSFLIVWPVFLSDENIIEELLEQKLVLRTLLVLLVVITYVTAKLSIVLFNLLNEAVNIYLQDFHYERLVNLIGDSLIWALLIVLLRNLITYMSKKLTRKVTFPQNILSQEYDQDYGTDSYHIESAATEEPEIDETVDTNEAR
ncbi:hypothetical protein [Oceanobacillus profundus]|uniref:hypothetical protein n=1 Tax=Oceanobacillus TaxID=182709 RepID=UPI0026E1CC06|nr:hypothetical protein [Oceanobacillus profundus]MDO6448996.1 hypothetical protein [Oceanobacillus profundus]